jgi:hypothetical protein
MSSHAEDPTLGGAGVPSAGTEAAVASYPVIGDIDHQDSYVRFLPLVKWLLAIPHYLVLVVLWLVAIVAFVVAFFAVLITGRFPRAIFDYLVGVMRWGWRVNAYVLLMTDRYPPFRLSEAPDDPARLDIEYPESVARWRPLVQWLLVLPVAVVSSLLARLVAVLAFFALFTIIFTKRIPAGMFDMMLIPRRWELRAMAYAGFMVTRYPPFAWV